MVLLQTHDDDSATIGRSIEMVRRAHATTIHVYTHYRNVSLSIPQLTLAHFGFLEYPPGHQNTP
jgi:hypothetical protein